MDEESFIKTLNDRSVIEVEHGFPSIELENFAEWLSRNENRLFRFWVYKRMFTPFEKAEQFRDESVFEDDFCTMAYIREAIQLPDGDILIGFEPKIEGKTKKYLEYYKLSEIRLADAMDEDEL